MISCMTLSWTSVSLIGRPLVFAVKCNAMEDAFSEAFFFFQFSVLMFLQVSASIPEVVRISREMSYSVLMIWLFFFFFYVVHLDKQGKIFPEYKKINYLYYDWMWVTAGPRIESVIRSPQAYLRWYLRRKESLKCLK